MDIEFFCSHCGQSLSIDESGAGITIDCPKCAKPAYVPSPIAAAPAPPSDLPTRVQPKQPPRQSPRPPATPKQPPARQTLPGHDFALSAGETVVLHGQMHSVVVALPGIGFVIVCIFLIILSALFQLLVQFLTRTVTGGGSGGPMLTGIFLLPCIPFLFVAVIGTFAAWLARRHTLITLTGRRLIINQGVLSKTTVELLLKQIETVSIRRPLVGRMFGYGTVVVRGTGGGRVTMPFTEKPEELYARLQDGLER